MWFDDWDPEAGDKEEPLPYCGAIRECVLDQKSTCAGWNRDDTPYPLLNLNRASTLKTFWQQYEEMAATPPYGSFRSRWSYTLGIDPGRFQGAGLLLSLYAPASGNVQQRLQ